MSLSVYKWGWFATAKSRAFWGWSGDGVTTATPIILLNPAKPYISVNITVREY